MGRSKQGYEMTIYMTPVDLSNPESLDINGNPISSGANVTVFAATYTSTDGGTTWSQIGELFHGYASLNDYDGGDGTDSFDTGTWRSSNEYNGVASGSTIKSVVQSYK
jgi:Neuraminidase (sialidase)